MAWTLHFHGALNPEWERTVSALLPKSALAAVGPIRAGRYDMQPFLLDAAGRPERVVNAYFGSRPFRGYAATTRKKYALSIKLWLNFCEARGMRWVDADSDAVADFKFWRMTDSTNPARVSGGAVHTDLAAMSALYRWAEPRYGVADPVLRRELHRPASTGYVGAGPAAAPAAEPAGVRDRNVKWLDPAAVRRWIDMGLRGLDRDGREDPRSRNRTGTRDAAFAGLLYGSGLRVSEGASLLLFDVPEDHDPDRLYRSGRLAAACAKGGRARQWWCPRAALSEVWGYVEGQRAEAVQRAQRHGRYEAQRGVRIVEARHGERRLVVRPTGAPATKSAVVSLDSLNPAERRRLFLETADGLEPAALWLNENGLPRSSHTWQGTFRTSNERLARAGLPWFRCTPHMLRHSFALRWYSVGRMLWDRRLAHLTDEEQRDFRVQFGDTWQFVQTLLGHRHPQTTVDIYLEPFKSLEVEVLLECAAEVPLTALMQMMFERDGRVLRDAAVTA